MKALLLHSIAKLQAGITGVDMKIYTAEEKYVQPLFG